MVDIAEQICQAVDEIVLERIKSINYDSTIIATIVDNTEKESGKYTCSNGSATFIAYGVETNYKVDESVLVTIPNNDYSQQKIITGRYTTETDNPFMYKSPFDTMVDITTNLVSGVNNSTFSLLANKNYDIDDEGVNIISTPLWSETFENGLVGFTRLGIQGKFRSWLSALNPKAGTGNYGYYLETFTYNSNVVQDKNYVLVPDLTRSVYEDKTNLTTYYLKHESDQGEISYIISTGAFDSAADYYILEVVSNNENIECLKKWTKLLTEITTAISMGVNSEYIIKADQYVFNQTPVAWYENVNNKYNLGLSGGGEQVLKSFVEAFKKADFQKQRDMTWAMMDTQGQFALFEFDSQEMYGDPNNYQNYSSQERVFKIENLGPIVGMSLYFYQKSGSFFDKEDKDLPYKDSDDKYLPNNLFTKDPVICLGYDAEVFDEDTVLLYSMNSDTYTFVNGSNEEDNWKTIQLRWVHQFDNGQITEVTKQPDENFNYEIRWYRYNSGAPSADEYSGVYWEAVQGDGFSYVLKPSQNVEFERVKAIVIYNGEIIRSNVLTFTNEQDIPDQSTVNLLSGLSIWCDDNSHGNYYFYGQNNNLIDESKANEILTFRAKFVSNDIFVSLKETDMSSEAYDLTEATKITWEFPYDSSMVIVNGFNYSFALEDNEKDANGNILWDLVNQRNAESVNQNGLSIFAQAGYLEDVEISVDGDRIYISRYPDKNGYIVNTQDYRIGKTYSQTYVDNTIKCTIIKNNLYYSATKELNFGIIGTSGTDATLVIDFDNNRTALNAKVAKEGSPETLPVTAKLYDYNHKLVDFNNKDLDLTCEWSWFAYHEYTEAEEQRLYKQRVQNFYSDKYRFVTLRKDNGEYYEELQNKSDGTPVDYSIRKAIRQEAVESNSKIKIGDIDLNHCVISHTKSLSLNNPNVEDYFLILQCTVSGYGNYPLTAYKPIPIRDNAQYRNIIGPTEVIYDSSGLISYYKEPYELWYCKDADKVDQELDTVASQIDVVKHENAIWKIHNPFEEEDYLIGLISDKNILKPCSIYTKDIDCYGVMCSVGGVNVWAQPIYVGANRYPSSTINQWDGTKVEVTEGYILAPAFASGRKETDNSFSGVMIGDWSSDKTPGGTESSITSQTGIYGFDHGLQSYALKEDGTAFIGKPGVGRILFDGDKGILTSAAYTLDSPMGMQINLTDGRIDAHQFTLDAGKQNYNGVGVTDYENPAGEAGAANNTIYLSTEAEEYPFRIGSKFKVNWDGSINATDGHFTGLIEGSEICLPNANYPNFRVTKDGELSIGGNILAGKPAFNVSSYGDVTITRGSIKLGEDSDSKYYNFEVDPYGTVKVAKNFYLGKRDSEDEDGNTITDYIFKVDENGNLKITGGSITLKNDKGDTVFNLTDQGHLTLYEGYIELGRGAFKVTNEGELTMRHGSINLGNNFIVEDDGKSVTIARDLTIGKNKAITLNSEGVLAIRKGSIGLGYNLDAKNDYNFYVNDNGQMWLAKDFNLGLKDEEYNLTVDENGNLKILHGTITLGKVEYQTAGGTTVTTPAFKVTDDGEMTLYKGSISLGGTPNNPVFKVDDEGFLTMTSGEIKIGGASTDPIFYVNQEGQLTVKNSFNLGYNSDTGDYNFKVSPNGDITITNGSIALGSNFSVTNEGVLTALKGVIGGWEIGDIELKSIGASDSEVIILHGGGEISTLENDYFFEATVEDLKNSKSFIKAGNGFIVNNEGVMAAKGGTIGAWNFWLEDFKPSSATGTLDRGAWGCLYSMDQGSNNIDYQNCYIIFDASRDYPIAVGIEYEAGFNNGWAFQRHNLAPFAIRRDGAFRIGMNQDGYPLLSVGSTQKVNGIYEPVYLNGRETQLEMNLQGFFNFLSDNRDIKVSIAPNTNNGQITCSSIRMNWDNDFIIYNPDNKRIAGTIKNGKNNIAAPELEWTGAISCASLTASDAISCTSLTVNKINISNLTKEEKPVGVSLSSSWAKDYDAKLSITISGTTSDGASFSGSGTASGYTYYKEYELSTENIKYLSY